jgi:hypothetical protein
MTRLHEGDNHLESDPPELNSPTPKHPPFALDTMVGNAREELPKTFPKSVINRCGELPQGERGEFDIILSPLPDVDGEDGLAAVGWLWRNPGHDSIRSREVEGITLLDIEGWQIIWRENPAVLAHGHAP